MNIGNDTINTRVSYSIMCYKLKKIVTNKHEYEINNSFVDYLVERITENKNELLLDKILHFYTKSTGHQADVFKVMEVEHIK